MSRPGESAGLDLALWCGGGAGLIGSLYFLLAWNGHAISSAFGLLFPIAVALLLSVIVLAACADSMRTRAGAAAVATAAIFTVALFVLNLVPPVARDELTHHLALPELYLSAGRAVGLPFAEQSYFPMQLTMLYTPFLAHGLESAPKDLHLLFGLASVGVIVLYLSSYLPAGVAAFVAVLLLTTPTFANLASSAYVDLGLFFFTTVALVALLRWSETDRSPLLALAGFAAGCAASVKYNGYLTVPLLAIGAIALSPRRDAMSLLRNLAIFAVPAVLPLVPWLFRNYLETGNPVFPLMRSTFGGPPRPDSTSIDILTKRRFLYGETWIEVLTTPFRAFVTGRYGDPARFDGTFNPLLLFGFLGALIGRRNERARYLWLFSISVLVLVFFLTTFRSRYAIAAVAALAILTAELIDHWRRTLPHARVLLPALGAAALAFNLWHFADYWRTMSPTSYLSGNLSRSDYITRFVPEYPLSEFANHNLSPHARVYLAFLGQRGYYWRRPYTYDFHYSGTSLRDAVREAQTAEGISDELRELGISHIAASAPLLGRYLQEDLTDTELSRWQAFASRHLRLLHSHGSFGLYEII